MKISAMDAAPVPLPAMKAPCCGGIENVAKQAIQASGKFLPWQVVTITTDGRIKA